LDKNGDGKITVEDVEIILKEMGLGFVSKHLARAIFNIVDANHNGRLDFPDLIALTALLKRLSNSYSSSSSSSSSPSASSSVRF
jgi:Ca2+-binding EF-hand superfamily protein